MNKVKVTPPPSLTVPHSIFVCCLLVSFFLFPQLYQSVSCVFILFYFYSFRTSGSSRTIKRIENDVRVLLHSNQYSRRRSDFTLQCLAFLSSRTATFGSFRNFGTRLDKVRSYRLTFLDTGLFMT